MRIYTWTLRFFLCLSILGAASANAEPTTLFLAHLNPNSATNNPTGAMATTFEIALETLTDGRINVETFPEGQLGGERQVVDLVRRGVIQSAIISVAGITKRYPLISVLSDPFRFRNLQDVYNVYDGPFGRYLRDDIEKKTGLSVLAFGDTGGLFVLTNSKRPIHSPEDLANLRIRTMALEEHKHIIRSLGGAPVALAWRELYASLQNGILDGQMNPPSIVRAGKLHQVQKYMTVTNHLYTPYLWIANAQFLAALSPETQKAIATAARAGVLASRRLAQSSNALESLAASMEIYQPTAAERRAFQKASRPAMNQFVHENLGAEGVRLLEMFRAGRGASKKSQR